MRARLDNVISGLMRGQGIHINSKTALNDTSPPTARFGHIPELNGIRAIAVVIVVASHFGMERFVPGGFGVTVFFFLSGYLISSLLRDEIRAHGTIDIGAFYLRRAFRILPPLYVVIGFTLMLASLGLISGNPSLGGIMLGLFFLTNYQTLFDLGAPLPLPLWSLAVEEHFYLLLPACLLFVPGRITPPTVALWCALGCVAVLAIRLASATISPDTIGSHYVMSHTRIDSILFGSILAFWNNPAMDEASWRPKSWHVLLAFLLVAASLLIRDEYFRETFRYTLQGIALFVLFSFALQAGGILGAILSSRIVGVVGLLSYTIYLVHIPIADVLRTQFPGMSDPVVAAIAVPAVLAFSGVTYLIVEKPAAKMRRNLRKPPLGT